MDIVYAAGKSCFAVSTIVDDAEDFLSTQWELVFKLASRLVMAPAAADDTPVSDSTRWPVVQSMEALGHVLEHDGAIETCFNRSCNNAWKAFFANCGARDASNLPISVRNSSSSGPWSQCSDSAGLDGRSGLPTLPDWMACRSVCFRLSLPYVLALANLRSNSYGVVAEL